MQSSTRWFLVIITLLLVFGSGAALIMYLVMSGMTDDEEIVYGSGDRVAVVELSGPIMSSEETVRQFKKYRDDHSVRAIVFRIDSPGGGVAASQEIYEEVKKTRQAGIPVIVSMASVAASGGYYVACGGSTLMANRGTLTGSIGVISQFMRFDPLMDKVGIDVNTIKSGRMKDVGNPFREMTQEDKEYLQSLMDQVHKQFLSTVEAERKLDHDSLRQYADGRVFTGEQAKMLGLIDTLGTFEDAVGLAAAKGGIRGKPSIVKERKRRPSLLNILTGDWNVSELLGIKDEILKQPILQYRMATGM